MCMTLLGNGMLEFRWENHGKMAGRGKWFFGFGDQGLKGWSSLITKNRGTGKWLFLLGGWAGREKPTLTSRPSLVAPAYIGTPGNQGPPWSRSSIREISYQIRGPPHVPGWGRLQVAPATRRCGRLWPWRSAGRAQQWPFFFRRPLMWRRP
jgi:hypothetical protein